MIKGQYLKILGVENLFTSKRTKEILDVNPTVIPIREEAKDISVMIYDFDSDSLEEMHSNNVEDCLKFKNNNRLSWINIDGLKKTEIEKVCEIFGVHYLLVEDILSVNQRPKMDEVEDILFLQHLVVPLNSLRNVIGSIQRFILEEMDLMGISSGLIQLHFMAIRIYPSII
jgi:magnesium transporter